MLKYVVVLCVVVSMAFAWESLAFLEEKPSKFKSVEGCYIKDLDTVIPFNQKKPSIASCFEYQCYRDIVKYVGCGSVTAPIPCTLIENKNKRFPECCPTIRCP